MVKEIERDNKKEYVCEACGFRYADKGLAERCEEWCTTKQSCNLEITAQGTPPESI